jgi:hypothetical protein
MIPLKKKSLIEYVQEWHEKLQKCHYAGEIYLGIEELHVIAEEFAARRNVLRKDHHGAVLLVLAVNCAYHYYDDEGFWKHFCALVKRENNIYEHETLGMALENCLRSYGLMKSERTGPFRYVGAILEQCGISRRYIPGFAYILKNLYATVGHENLLNMSHFKFKRKIEFINCARYLKSFLLDTAGWQFTLQVCHLMQQYREGEITLGELEELPGFQPGFWTEFLSNFDIKQRKSGERSKYAYFKPRLVFLPGESRVGLQFPFPEFTKIIERPSVAKAWKYPVTVLDDKELWSDEYSGRVIDEKGRIITWRVKGWLPDGLPVLFDIKNGLLQRNELIYPGTYYLLIPRGYGFNCMDKEYLGSVYTPGAWNYQAYRVRLGRDDVIHGYGLAVEDLEKNIEIEWVRPGKKRLNYAADDYFDVFVGSLPEINITNFSYIESNAVGLFCDLGEGAVRLRSQRDIQEFRLEARRRAPVRGRIWLSNFSRGWINPGQRNISGLQFCLLPDCQISHEQRVYGYDEKVVLTLDRCSPCRLNLGNCRRLDKEGRRWAVPAEENFAGGALICGDVSVGIRVPVHRAGIYHSNGRRVRYICISELESEADFIITGYPDTVARLVTEGNVSVNVEVVFNKYGRTVVNSVDLLRLAGSRNGPACEIFLEAGGDPVSTGAILIDLKEIQNKVYRGESCRITSTRARNLSLMVNLCAEICRSPMPEVKMNRLPCYSPDFDEWVNTVLGCAVVFDGTHIMIGDTIFDWHEKIRNTNIKKVLNLYRELKAGIPSTGTIDTDPGVLPDVERWRKAMADLLKMNTREGTIDILREWSGDVLRQQGAFRSRIAGHPGGNSLTRAWRYYHRKETMHSLELINNIRDGSDLVNDLKILLHTLVLLRTARLRSAARMAGNVELVTDIALVYEILRFVMSGFSGETLPKPDVKAGLEIAGALPLRPEDYDYLKIAAVPDVYNKDVIDYCHGTGDWLLLYTLINFLKPCENRAFLSARLLGMDGLIPASPEKGDIINRVISYVRRN